MKVKTALKVGKTAQSVLQDLGHKTALVWNKAVRTVSSRKFWTWPF